MGACWAGVGRAAAKGRVEVRVGRAAVKRIFHLEGQQMAAALDTQPSRSAVLNSLQAEGEPACAGAGAERSHGATQRGEAAVELGDSPPAPHYRGASQLKPRKQSLHAQASIWMHTFRQSLTLVPTLNPLQGKRSEESPEPLDSELAKLLWEELGAKCVYASTVRVAWGAAVCVDW